MNSLLFTTISSNTLPASSSSRAIPAIVHILRVYFTQYCLANSTLQHDKIPETVMKSKTFKSNPLLDVLFHANIQIVCVIIVKFIAKKYHHLSYFGTNNRRMLHYSKNKLNSVTRGVSLNDFIPSWLCRAISILYRRITSPNQSKLS